MSVESVLAKAKEDGRKRALAMHIDRSEASRILREHGHGGPVLDDEAGREAAGRRLMIANETSAQRLLRESNESRKPMKSKVDILADINAWHDRHGE